MLLSLQVRSTSATQRSAASHCASTAIVLLKELSWRPLAADASPEVQRSRRVSLIRAAASNRAELLDLKVLESNVLLLKLEVLALDPLQVTSPSLELVLKFSYLGIVGCLHLSHFSLYVLNHQLLLLIIAGPCPFR